MIKAWREQGYQVRLDFLWIPDLGITRTRVRQRVVKGGHDIPVEVQQRRFHLGIRNLVQLYRPLVHRWRLFDNSGDAPLLVAQEEQGLLAVEDAAQLDLIERSASVSFMSNLQSDRMDEPAVFLTFEEETRRAVRAMRKAFADVVLENKAYGLPVIQWRQGRGVVEVPAEQLEPLARRILEVNGEPLPEAEERALLAHVKV